MKKDTTDIIQSYPSNHRGQANTVQACTPKSECLSLFSAFGLTQTNIPVDNDCFVLFGLLNEPSFANLDLSSALHCH